MSCLQPITNNRNLGQQAYEQLRNLIIILQLEPGQIIQEKEIAESLGISRTPIRDAFHLLISEGLIDVLPQRTKHVAYISENKVMESSLVRLSLEMTAFEQVTNNWNQDDAMYMQAERRIQRIIEEQHDAVKAEDVKEFLDLDEQFHSIILQMANNQTLINVIYQMRGHLNRFRYLAMKELVLTGKLTIEHENLFNEIKKNNVDEVKRLLTKHLSKIEEEIPSMREKFPHYFKE